MRDHLIRRLCSPACLFLLLATPLTGCGTASDDPAEQATIEDANDPFEPVNRYFFEINYAFDELVFKPFAGWYRLMLPEFARDRVADVLRNVNEPVTLANDLMQGEWERAGDTAARFAINTTLGVVGLFDVAQHWGLRHHSEDFGQTLAVWGVAEGPYLMLPLLGPSTVRDGASRLVDAYFDAFSYLAALEGITYAMTTRRVLEGLELRSRNLETVDALRAGSLDYYASLRSVYLQNRAFEIANGEAAFDAEQEKDPGEE
jgi:phospholipid-binding lipoprotein MlaA